MVRLFGMAGFDRTPNSTEHLELFGQFWRNSAAFRANRTPNTSVYFSGFRHSSPRARPNICTCSVTVRLFGLFGSPAAARGSEGTGALGDLALAYEILIHGGSALGVCIYRNISMKGSGMNAIDRHNRAHAALSRAHELLDLRTLYIDPLSTFYTRHHAWMECYCVFRASNELHVVVKHRPAGQALLNRPD